MNFAFLYFVNEGSYETAISGGPYSTVVANPSYFLSGPFSDRTDATAILNTPGTQVDHLVGYLSLGRAQQGLDWFDQIGEAFRTDNPTNTPLPADPALHTYDLYFWHQEVRDVLKAELDTQEAQGFTGVFLDDTIRYGIYQDLIFADTGGSFDEVNVLSNAALATMDAITDLANSTPVDTWANVDAYMISSHVGFLHRFGPVVQAFAEAVEGVVIEGYWTHVSANLGGYLTAIKTYADLGIEVRVSSDFDINPATTGALAFSRENVNDYYLHAAKLGYEPTASKFDSRETNEALFNQFFDDMPVFNVASDQSDVLAALNGAGDLAGGKGADALVGLGFDDTLRGNGGRDKLFGQGGDDNLFGGNQKDRLWGNQGKDLLKGGKGNDILNGGGGRDDLQGGEGVDVLNGGGGNDTLDGQNGADVFVFSGAFGKDRVVFEAVDTIRFKNAAGEVTDFDGFLAAAQQVGADTVYDLGNDGLNVIILQDTVRSELVSGQFEFL